MFIFNLPKAMHAVICVPLFVRHTNDDLALDMSRLLQDECLHNTVRCEWEGTSRIDARCNEALGNKPKDSI